MKRLCTLILSALLLISMIPSTALAKEDLGSSYKILLSADSYSYTGAPIEAKFYVVPNDIESWILYDSFGKGGSFEGDPEGYILPESNYTFEYKNNVNTGDATLTVHGKGDYSGTLTKTFNISAAVQNSLKTTVNSDKSVTIESLADGLKAKDIKKVIVWSGGRDGEYEMKKGSEYKAASDGAVTVTKKFLDGDTGFKALSGKLKIRVETANRIGYAKVKFYNISSIYSWDNAPLIYSGKNKTPKVTVDGLKKGTDFKVVFSKSKRKEIGVYTYTIKGIGDCKGSQTCTFKVNPKKPASAAVKSSKSKATVSWKKVTNCSGYQIQLIRPSDEESDMISYVIYKRATVKDKNKTSIVFKDAKRTKYTRVRVRAYKTVKGKKYYSKWKYN